MRTMLISSDKTGLTEKALAAYVVKNGDQQCCVGFLPSSVLQKAAEYHMRIGQVISFGSYAKATEERIHSFKNCGTAKLVLVDVAFERDVKAKYQVDNYTEFAESVVKKRKNISTTSFCITCNKEYDDDESEIPECYSCEQSH